MAIATSSFAQQRPAYLIAEYEVLDAARMKKFGDASNPIVAAHGGQFVARRSKISPVIGEAPKALPSSCLRVWRRRRIIFNLRNIKPSSH
jgi:hypothetical protein